MNYTFELSFSIIINFLSLLHITVSGSVGSCVHPRSTRRRKSLDYTLNQMLSCDCNETKQGKTVLVVLKSPLLPHHEFFVCVVMELMEKTNVSLNSES